MVAHHRSWKKSAGGIPVGATAQYIFKNGRASLSIFQ